MPKTLKHCYDYHGFNHSNIEWVKGIYSCTVFKYGCHLRNVQGVCGQYDLLQCLITMPGIRVFLKQKLWPKSILHDGDKLSHFLSWSREFETLTNRKQLGFKSNFSEQCFIYALFFVCEILLQFRFMQQNFIVLVSAPKSNVLQVALITIKWDIFRSLKGAKNLARMGNLFWFAG